MSELEHPQWWETARKLRARGKTEAEIAAACGVSRGAVCRALRPDYYDQWAREREEAQRLERAKKAKPVVSRWAKRHGFDVTDEQALELLKDLHGHIINLRRSIRARRQT